VTGYTTFALRAIVFFHWAGRKQLDLSGINKSLRKDYSLYCGISTNGLNMLNAKVL
jgi:hypothetical protein